GYIVYSNEAKINALGVDLKLIERYGAVSEPVARALAEGARMRARSTFALSTTGIAGPTGGSPGKPVGTVYVALASLAQTIAGKSHEPFHCCAYEMSSAWSRINSRTHTGANDTPGAVHEVTVKTGVMIRVLFEHG